MTADEALAWKLNGKELVKGIAAQLPIEACVKPVGRNGLWEVGRAWMKDGQRRTVLAALAGKRPELEGALTDLFVQSYREFLLLVADPGWCGSDLGPRLESLGGEAFTLGAFVEAREGAFARGALVGRLLTDGPVVKGRTVDEARPYSLRCRGVKDYRAKGVKRQIRHWAIRFREREFDLPNAVGAEYLVHLLLHGGKELRPDALITAVEGTGVAVVAVGRAKDMVFDTEGQLKGALRWQPDASQDVLDDAEISRYKEMIKALNIGIQEAKDDPGQTKELVSYEEKRDSLVEFLKASTRPGLRGQRLPKRFANDTFSRQANLVAKHLRKVLKYLKANEKELWNHLNDRATLRYGESNCYTAPKGVEWRVIE